MSAPDGWPDPAAAATVNASDLAAARFLESSPALSVYGDWSRGPVVFPDGAQFTTCSTVESRPFWVDVTDGVWELQTFEVLAAVLGAGSGSGKNIYIDVGMWIAPTVLFASTYASAVYAFEADPYALYEGAANLVANPAAHAKTRVARRCINDVAGTLRMAGFGGSVSRIVVEADDAAAADAYLVPCTTLPAALADLRVPLADVGLIKMDIEGSEARVIPALVAAGWFAEAGAPSLWLSVHPPLWPAADRPAVWASLATLAAQYRRVFDGSLAPVDLTAILAANPNGTSGYTEFLFTNVDLDARLAAFHVNHLPPDVERNPGGTHAWRNVSYGSARGLPPLPVAIFDNKRA